LSGEWSFATRQRRPPPDPINALLSLGYTLLSQNCVAACEAVGLDPFDGFYHSDRYGRPALALDLMEEFRSIIVDSVVLNLVNRRMLASSDFEPGPEGRLYLKPKGMRMFFFRYAARLQTAVLHPQIGRTLTYQKCLEFQARLLRKFVTGEAAEYIPFVTK
jgi:CRISPR-associated protein Cas1